MSQLSKCLKCMTFREGCFKTRSWMQVLKGVLSCFSFADTKQRLSFWWKSAPNFYLRYQMASKRNIPINYWAWFTRIVTTHSPPQRSFNPTKYPGSEPVAKRQASRARRATSSNPSNLSRPPVSSTSTKTPLWRRVVTTGCWQLMNVLKSHD